MIFILDQIRQFLYSIRIEVLEQSAFLIDYMIHTTSRTQLYKNSASLLLVAFVGFVFPDMAFASGTNNTQLVFAISENTTQAQLLEKQSTGLSIQEITETDILALSVQSYLEKKRSPLAQYAHLIIQEPNWQQALGIIAVESTYCKNAANFNCGSVGVKPGHKQWRKFNNHFDGFKAVSTLLEKPLYKEKYKTCKQKMGVYVVPGSSNWLKGCEKVEKDMFNLEQQAREEVAVRAQSPKKELAFAR